MGKRPLTLGITIILHDAHIKHLFAYSFTTLIKMLWEC